MSMGVVLNQIPAHVMQASSEQYVTEVSMILQSSQASLIFKIDLTS